MDHPIHVSDSVRLLIADSFTSDALRHLAALRDAGSPRAAARRSLDTASVEELADMIVGGGTPTVGWWRRHSGMAA